MSTERGTGTATGTGTALTWWQSGIVGGLIGTIAFGLIMMFVIEDPVLEVAIPNMYGVEATPNDEALLIGWVAHLFHGVVLGVVFAALLRIDALREFASDNARIGVLGLVYGIVAWAILAVFVMPVWLDAVGFGGAPEVPNVGELSLLGHAVYGVLLGLVYAVTVGE